MRAVIDTSTWVSCARAGLLPLLDACGLDVVTLDVVRNEAVTAGMSAGYPDAAILETALAGRPLTSAPTAPTPDAAVLLASQDAGLLVTNDLALGRRARNLGIGWLRTADVVVLAVRRGDLSPRDGRAGITALRDAHRITAELAEDYLEELR